MMQYFDNVLNDDQYNYVLEKTILGDKWKYIGYSKNQSDYKFWYTELEGDPFFENNFLKIIEKLSNKKFEIQRVYANGQTYGQPGNVHKDVYTEYAPELYHTFVYYVNPVWDLSWGGATQVVQPTGEISTIMPIRNTGILFNSTLNHVGSEPTRYCPELRVTVAFKLKEII
jgi:Rps23 Pro-64 3,4-dihydroxylase Tpa1-like proline 4-hydroxylase